MRADRRASAIRSLARSAPIFAIIRTVHYYYGGLSLLSARDSGFQDYALGCCGPAPVRVPTSGYFVESGYILTGETIRDRALIDALRPFDLRASHFLAD